MNFREGIRGLQASALAVALGFLATSVAPPSPQSRFYSLTQKWGTNWSSLAGDVKQEVGRKYLSDEQALSVVASIYENPRAYLKRLPVEEQKRYASFSPNALGEEEIKDCLREHPFINPDSLKEGDRMLLFVIHRTKEELNSQINVINFMAYSSSR